MIQLISNLPVVLLTILIFLYKKNQGYLPIEILKFCIKDEILFRWIPYYILDKNLKNCVYIGVLNGLYLEFNYSMLALFFNIVASVIYSITRMKYSFIELIAIRYFLILILLDF